MVGLIPGLLCIGAWGVGKMFETEKEDKTKIIHEHHFDNTRTLYDEADEFKGKFDFGTVKVKQ